jgi:thiamine transport system substrate-binding protein
VNVDDTWFADHDLAPPPTLDDLTDPAYRGPVRHSRRGDQLDRDGVPARHIAEYGDGWPDYWSELMATAPS